MKTRIPALLAMTGALVLVACTIIMPIIMPILNEFLLENLHLSYEDYQSFAMVIGLLDLILTSISLCLIAVHFVFSIKKHAIPSILALAGILVMLVIFWLVEIVFVMGVFAYPQGVYHVVWIIRSMLALLGMLLLSVYFVASFKEYKVSSVLALAGIFLYVLCSMCIMFQNSVYAVVGIENIYQSDTFLTVIISTVIPAFINFASTFVWVMMAAAFAVRLICPGQSVQQAN